MGCRALGRTALDTKLAELKRAVEVRPGCWCGVKELDPDSEGHRLFQLDVLKGELPHIIPSEGDIAAAGEAYVMGGGAEAE